MISFILGTQNSGKSELAERLSMESGDRRRYYLATMKICDEAGRLRVEKHRQQREGKGFVTIEREYDMRRVPEEIEEPQEVTLLLECVSNLVGNEMHENPYRGERERIADRIAEDIRFLAGRVHNIIIVSNEYAGDAEGYDEETREYVRLLNLVNERIRSFSDKVIDMRKGSKN